MQLTRSCLALLALLSCAFLLVIYARKSSAQNRRVLRHFDIYNECYEEISSKLIYVPLSSKTKTTVAKSIEPGAQVLMGTTYDDSVETESSSTDHKLHWSTRTIPLAGLGGFMEYTHVIACDCPRAEPHCSLPRQWPNPISRQYPDGAPHENVEQCNFVHPPPPPQPKDFPQPPDDHNVHFRGPVIRPFNVKCWTAEPSAPTKCVGGIEGLQKVTAFVPTSDRSGNPRQIDTSFRQQTLTSFSVGGSASYLKPADIPAGIFVSFRGAPIYTVTRVRFPVDMPGALH
jgi:hypothetical protein